MCHGEAIMLSPVVGHLVGLMMIPCQLVKDVFWIRVSAQSMLVDLFNIKGAGRGVRVPDLDK